MSDRKQLRVLWLTNLPAPYRFPIWDFMSKFVTLNVVFLLKRKNWRNWPEPLDKRWSFEYLSLNSLQVSEYDIVPSVRGAKKILENIDVAIIGGWESPIYIRTILRAKKKRIKIIQFYESTSDSHRFNNGLVAHIRKWIFSKPDKFITISESSKKTLLAMGIAPEKILTLFNPVDVSWFFSFAQNHRTQLESGHHYIYVGQLIERKNVASILRSFATIRNPDDTLTIAGDGPLARNLQGLAASLGVAESVIFTGAQNQENLARLYSASNTLILASTSEVWGLVVNEALASGLQVVVTEKCGVAEFVQEMKGVIICGADRESLQEAMRTSRLKWKGYIEDPDIISFTPDRFAFQVLAFIS